MSDEEKDESVLDTVRAAFESSQPKEEAPKDAAPAEEERAEHDDGAAEEPTEAKAPEDEDNRPVEDQRKEPEKAVSDESAKPDITRPPKRLPVRTKTIWQTIAPELREDIVLREQEFDKAYKRYEGLGQFAAQAERNETTLANAMRSYHAMEMALRTDPIDGFTQTLRALRIDPEVVYAEIYRRMSGGGNNGGAPAAPAPPPIQGPQGMSREEMAAELDRQFQQRDIQSQIAAFEADPRNYYLEPRDEVGPIRKTMQAFLMGGVANNLRDAYDMACRANGLNPDNAPRPNGNAADQEKKAAAAKQARQQAKATVGVPSQKAERETPDSGNETILDTVRAAYRKHRGE